MADIRKELKDLIKKHKLIERNDKIVIGVSGGADSICLLYLLKSLRKEFGLTIYIAHLDHLLRQESGKDAQFVKKLGQKLGIPVILGSIDVRGLDRKTSLEESARNVRLEFLAGVANKLKAGKIALAHNFDDQAETVLMRILRGAGLSGLSGIPLKRKMGKVEIIRPLLNARRKDIESFLKKRKISFCIDKSNTDEVYFRNKIRHKLLPLLEKDYNSNIREVLFSLAQNSGSDYEYLKASAARFLKNNNSNLDLVKLKALHPSIMRLKLREAIASLQGDTRRITFKHIQELEDLISNRPQGSVVDLPKGIQVKKTRKSLKFIRF
ncbi:MAG TPA: tRNA lysidine(34) synthetase TilS [Candidatus Omnitrophota bacterium]|nr:tRNA lysidine(34) synthetase TilS [Candidatus Omnitrophota bacterium]